MKKILVFSIILLICFSISAIATKDLVIKSFEVKDDIVQPSGKSHYILEVQNIGDETVTTCLPLEIYFDVMPEYQFPRCILRSLTNTRSEGSDVMPVTIISEDGTETSVTPRIGEITYMKPALTEEEYQERRSYLDERLSQVKSEEEIAEALAELENQKNNPYEMDMETYVIMIPAGETVRFDSELSYNEFENVAFPVGPLSLDIHPITINLMLDRLSNTDDNMNNNEFTAEAIMNPTVLQGPLQETEKNVELEDENEYMGFASGCVEIQGKNICISMDDPNIPDEEENLVISVDDVDVEYSYYGLFMSWFNKLFFGNDGKLAPKVTANDVEISLYPKGFKLKFK